MKARILLALLVAVVGAGATAPSSVLAEDRRSSISGTAWFDANVNGKPDTQERAVRNIQIDLEGPDYRESRKTGDDGTYAFEKLAGGRYKITIKLPTGYGLSAGENNKEMTVDGRNDVKYADWGIAKADQLPSPTALPTSTVPRPTFTPYVPPTHTPLPQSPSGAAFGAQSGGPAVSAAPGAPRQAPLSGLANPTRSEATPTPPPTVTPPPTPTLQPTSTASPTPTRTPPAIDGQQVAAERGRAALSEPGSARFGSSRQGDDVLLDVPFRSTADGSDYADTNSGTAAVAMALEAYGFNASTADLRALANTVARNYDVGQPPRIDMLVRVAEQASLRGLGLFQSLKLAIWTTDMVRERIQAGYPVLTMIRLEELEGDGELGKEHFVLIVGYRNGAFVYHDPAFPDDRGSKREISPKNLLRAWTNSPASSQAAALALGPQELSLLASPDDIRKAQQPAAPPAEVREVPTAAASQPLAVSQLLPAAAPDLDVSSSRPLGNVQVHPLLLLFGLVAGFVLIQVVKRLVFD